jgi:hypothetical protein
VINPQLYALKLCLFYKTLWPLDSFIYQDSIIGAVGRRAGALFFAVHRDYFIVTRNISAIYLDLVPFSSFIVTTGFAAVCRDWQKTRHRDVDGT